jgi:hypothetical protein
MSSSFSRSLSEASLSRRSRSSPSPLLPIAVSSQQPPCPSAATIVGVVTFFLLAIVGTSTLILRNSQPIVAASVESVGIAARQLSEDVATATIVQQAKPADVKAAAAYKSPEAIPPARAVAAAPAAPTPCRDKNDRCADWASAGECVKNAAYMEAASAQSAATDLALRLADESKQCPTWAASGECTRNQVYMAKSCARSCWLYGQAQANPAAGASPHDES